MKTSKRRTFSAEFKLEAASLVTEQGKTNRGQSPHYSHFRTSYQNIATDFRVLTLQNSVFTWRIV